ncbi:MAG: hypothetical protein ACFNX1_09190 [Treponema lecithinolyticum]|uniref:hypothetical protein n=1 Tax=Treponema lecithinolyticum TaxID=53418 RepID=UPI0036206520
MKKKWIVVLAGILLFGVGYIMLTISPDPMEENLELARQAENPKEAAAAIAANNSKSAVSSTIAYLFVGAYRSAQSVR